jgi:hypothetical protein
LSHLFELLDLFFKDTDFLANNEVFEWKIWDEWKILLGVSLGFESLNDKRPNLSVQPTLSLL